ncbi:MAG: hypothetical protein IPG83_18110 [Novosphingobium sp.]|mgnify:CR=1 FL=1|jgi:hypothetical protein|nr:hypothetical protein [Novosphingobium sp.]
MTSKIEQLFRQRRSGEDLTQGQQRALFDGLRWAILPTIARRQALAGPGDAAKRVAGGLTDPVEDHWQDFIENIVGDPVWGPADPATDVTIGYVANAFRNHLNSQRRRPGLQMVALDTANSAAVTELAGDDWRGDSLDSAEPVSTGEPGAPSLRDAETAEHAWQFRDRAKAFLDAPQTPPWVAKLVEYLLEPVVLHDADPIERTALARDLGIAPSTVTKYAQKLGLPKPGGNDPSAWRETMIGRYVMQECQISNPRTERAAVMGALVALCLRNVERRRVVQ